MSEITAWGFYADVLDLVTTALSLALLVGGVCVAVAGVLFEPWVGFAAAAAAGLITVLLTVVSRRSKI